MHADQRGLALWEICVFVVLGIVATVLLSMAIVTWLPSWLEPPGANRDAREQANLAVSCACFFCAAGFATAGFTQRCNWAPLLVYMAIPSLWIWAWATCGGDDSPGVSEDYKPMAYLSDANSAAFLGLALLELRNRLVSAVALGTLAVTFWFRYLSWDPGMDLGWSVAIATTAPIALGLAYKQAGLWRVSFLVLCGYGLLQAPAYSAYALIHPPGRPDNVDVFPGVSLKDVVLYVACGGKVFVVIALGAFISRKR